MRAEDCALIILAAGLSMRFGESDKLMAEFQGKPLVKHVIDTVSSIPFAERFAVVPKASEHRKKLFNYEGYSLLENEAPQLGQGESLRIAAVGAKAKGHKAIFVMLGDMPFLQKADVTNFLSNLMGQDRAISYCNKTILPPAFFANEAMQDLTQLESKRGAKALFETGNFYKHPLSERATRDIDTPETLAEFS